MGLKRWLVEREARAWLKAAESGQEGSEVQAAIYWVKTHKALLSKLTAGVVAGLAAAGYTKAAAIGLSLATFLAGAGYLESDAFHKS